MRRNRRVNSLPAASFAQIGAALGISRQAAEQTYAAAMRKLRNPRGAAFRRMLILRELHREHERNRARLSISQINFFGD